MDDRTSFIFNGEDSRDYHMYIENDVSFPSPEADIQFVEVAGRDGDLVIDNERMKGVDFSLPVIVQPPKGVRIDELASRITRWMKADFGWKPLVLGTGSEYEYTALPYHAFDLQRTIMNHGRTILRFRLKPYKYARHRSIITLKDERVTINNPETIASEPIIEISGSGDFELRNRGHVWFQVKGVENSITIDSEMKVIHKYRRPEYDKFIPWSGFPQLDVGTNWIDVETTGHLNQVEIDPNWRAFI